MNCDEAFECLTDPVRRQEPELQWHLDLCPRCRNMQQTLEPALALFDAAAEESAITAHQTQGGGLAGGRPRRFLSAEAVDLARQSAEALSDRSPERRQVDRRPWTHVFRYAAVFVLGAVLAFGLFGPGLDQGGIDSGAVSPAGGERCTWQSPHRQRVADRKESRTVVLSCVACHLAGTLD